MGLMDGWMMVQTNYCFWNDVLSDGLQFAIWGCGCTARTHHGICALRIRQFGYAFGAPYVIHQYVTRKWNCGIGSEQFCMHTMLLPPGNTCNVCKGWLVMFVLYVKMICLY